VLAGPYEDGDAAYKRGDYSTALRLWRPLAEQGHAKAQNNLGLIYADGLGVPQNYATAVKWYRKAAEQGHAIAQSNLGVMYRDGEGVSRDYVEAHKWFSLAATREYKMGADWRDILAKKMTPAQIAEAQRLAREWKPKK
jgi:TPR repeat protein